MDWIKMRSDIYRDPRVCEMAEIVSESVSAVSNVTRNVTPALSCVTRNAVVGALVTFWGVVRHRGHRDGDDLVIPRMKISTVDTIVELSGFAKAMVAVGWIIEEPESLVLPRFFEDLNTDPYEKSRQQNAERQRRYRDRKRGTDSNVTRNVTNNVTVTSPRNVEKRREEKRRDNSISMSVPTVEQVEVECKAKGYSAINPTSWWAYWDSVGWKTRNGVPIKWQSRLMSDHHNPPKEVANHKGRSKASAGTAPNRRNRGAVYDPDLTTEEITESFR